MAKSPKAHKLNKADSLPASSPTSETQPKPRFSRKATFLHAGSLILMFGVFMFLSIQLYNRSLIERTPVGGEGYLLQIQPNGETQKTPFTLTASQAIEMASIIDQADYQKGRNEKILGQVTIDLDKNYYEKFNITPSGVVRFRGWNRSGALPEDQAQRLLEIAIIGAN